MNVLLTGGSGRLARLVIAASRPPGITYRAMSRRVAPAAPGVEPVAADLGTGEGLDRAVAGADAVVHLASDVSRARLVDVDGTRRLVAACDAAGVRHLLYLSIIGVDAIPFAYYRAKLDAERIVAAGATPWTVVRAAQFHSFIDYLLSRMAGTPLVMPVPVRWQVQSVDDAEVAAHLVALLGRGPAGRVADFAGPRAMRVGEAARLWRAARGVRKPVLPFDLPGGLAAGFRAGRNTAPAGVLGAVTWEAWLARQRR